MHRKKKKEKDLSLRPNAKAVRQVKSEREGTQFFFLVWYFTNSDAFT